MKNFKNKLSNAIYTVLCVVFLCTSCTSSDDFEKGKKQLEQQGYNKVENTGWAAFCCSDEDSFSTGFKAKDKQGRTVKGCFCGGVLKGVTIRFE